MSSAIVNPIVNTGRSNSVSITLRYMLKKSGEKVHAYLTPLSSY